MVMQPIPIHDKATRYKSQRNGKDDGSGNGLGVGEPGDPMNTLTAGDRNAVCIGNGQLHNMSMSETANTLDCMHDQQAILTEYAVRRLTPLECCRLQGFPDRWEDGVEGSDSARYKMWGNGMALPCMLYVLAGIRDAV